MNIILRLSSLVSTRGFYFKNKQIFFLFFSTLTILYITQSYRIFIKSSDWLNLIRTTEDYALIFIFINIVIFIRQLRVRALVPFTLLFFYGGFYYIVALDLDFLRGHTLTMLWYLTAINIVTYLKPNHLFYILSSVGLISAFSLLLNAEQTVALYILGENRMHAEGEGMAMNINNIALILVAITTAANVLIKNIPKVKYSSVLIITLYISVAIVLLIASSRSAIIFFIASALYGLSRGSVKRLIMPLLIMGTVIGVGLYIFSDELVIFNRFLNADFTSSQRYISLQSSLAMFINNPLFGITDAKLFLIQVRDTGTTDHTLYTYLLASHGLIGFVFVMIFFNSMTTKFTKKLDGFFLLKGFFFYSLIFSPAGPGNALMAVVIYYLSELKETTNNLGLSHQYRNPNSIST